MSLTYDIANIDCNLPIYETANEQMWIDCNGASNRRGAWIFTAVLIVITILIIFFAESTLYTVMFTLGAVVVIGAIIAGTYLYMPGHFSREWKQYEKRLDVIQAQLGTDRPGAIKEYVRRVEEQNRLDANREIARAQSAQARAQTAQVGLNVGNAIRGWTTKS